MHAYLLTTSFFPDWEFVDSSLMDQYLDDNCLLRKKDTGIEPMVPVSCSVVDNAYVNYDHLPKTDLLEVEDEKSPMPLKANVWDSVLLTGSEFPGLGEINRPIEETLSDGGKIILGDCYVGIGAKWESYLHSEYQQIMDVGYLQHAPSCEDDEDHDGEIPLSVAVRQWIDEEILYQYPH